MNQIQYNLQYAAGLLEGEGSFNVFTTEHGHWYAVQCNMTDVEPLRIIESLLGGKIYGPYHYKPDIWKPFWQWRVSTREEVASICETLRSYMSPRRQTQIDVVLRTMSEHPRKIRASAEHGTISMYNHQKCRCEDCRNANNVYKITLRKAA